MIIPAIDLQGGQVVRLKQGDFNQKTVFNFDPTSRILQAANQGAQMAHIVDLDGAKNPAKRQRAAIGRIVKASPIPIQTGGGIRSASDVKNLLNSGVERVVIGSVAVKEPELVRGWMRRFGSEHITLAFDVRIIDGTAYVATHGWLQTSNLKLETAVSRYLSSGLEHVLVTDISKDGMMKGANTDLYAKLAAQFPELDIIASGGISSLDDIKAVAQSGATSVVLGRSLLEGRFTVKEAIKCWQNA